MGERQAFFSVIFKEVAIVLLHLGENLLFRGGEIENPSMLRVNINGFTEA